MIIKMLTTRNVGPIDRILRTLPAILVALAWYTGWIGGLAAILLAAVAGMLLLTSVLGSCSIYYMLGFSTCPISGDRRPRA
jgi:glucose-6-phosphate-specific signal transduction histidine kinase